MNTNFKNLVFYEIYPNSFKDSNDDGYGDIQGIISKIDYLKDLGINAIWLNPHYDSPFMDGGYDVRDFFKVSPRFGTEEDFKELVKKLHDAGIKLIVDLVAGHSSEENEMFKLSGSPKKSEYDDLYIWTNCAFDIPKEYRFMAGKTNRDGAYMINFFATQPAFNFGWNEMKYPHWQMSYKDKRTYKARDLIVKICNFWLDLGVDGFRVDMASSLVKSDKNFEGTIEVWKYIFDRVKKNYPNSFFVSEWNDPDNSFKAGFDADFALDFPDSFQCNLLRKEHFGKASFLKLNSELDISQSLKEYEDLVYRNKDKGYYSFITCNHDTGRPMKFLDEKELRLFYALVLTLPGIPFLYYGDEIAMLFRTDIDSKECGYARTGSRTPMQWDDSLNQGFSNCKPEDMFLPTDHTTSVESKMNDKNSVFYLVKNLINLRKNDVSLQGNDFKVINYGENHYISYKRNDEIVVVNPSNKDIEVPNYGTIIFADGTVESKGDIIVVGSQSSAIIKQK